MRASIHRGVGFVLTAIHRDDDGAGLEVIDALKDTDYGSHTFNIRDRDGNLWSIGTSLGK